MDQRIDKEETGSNNSQLPSTETQIRRSNLGEEGCLVSDFIERQGNNPPLQKVNLRNCSLPDIKWSAIFQFFTTCINLNQLVLSGINLRATGRLLAQSIRYLGNHDQLQILGLEKIQVPTTDFAKVLQSLSTCKQLTMLYLSYNIIGEAGYHLAESIISWGSTPPLQKFYLYDCRIPANACRDLLLSLSSCNQMNTLVLCYNMIGHAGSQLAQSIRAWGDNSPLENLYLLNCSIPIEESKDIFQSLSACKHLTIFNMSHNVIGNAGLELAKSIRSWGDHPPLQKLYLDNCFIPADILSTLKQSLSTCKQLKQISARNDSMKNFNQFLKLNYNEKLEKAYKLACLKDMKEPFTACLELVGDTWIDIFQSLVVSRRLTLVDIPDGFYLQICGSINDDTFQQSEVWKIFFVKGLNLEHLK